MDKNQLNKIINLIQFLDKISYIPALSVSIIFFLIFLEIITVPLDWIYLISNFLLGAIISFLIYSYDRNYISKKIKNEEYDQVILDGICWGIIGCLFYGIGVIIFIKGILVIYYNYNEFIIRKSSEIGSKHTQIDYKIYNSISSVSRLAGIVIVLLVFYNFGLEILLLAFNQLIFGNLQVIFEPFFLGLISLVFILLFEYTKDEILKFNQLSNSKEGAKDIIKGIIGCWFYAAGIFILLRGIVLIIIMEHIKSHNKADNAKKVKDLIIYSKKVGLKK
ncbi:MAG: hypothetical protein ACFFFB_24670 [Candidatus Heimdallarchaeota archaeon]